MKMFTDKISTPCFALGLLTIAMGIVPLNHALIKLMSEDIPLGQIVAIRAVVTLGLLGIFSHSLRSMLALPARVFWLFFARGMCLVLAMVLFFDTASHPSYCCRNVVLKLGFTEYQITEVI